MNYQDAMLIAAKKLEIPQLIVICINDVASKLHPYMQYLKVSNRSSEYAVVESYRQQLFECRDRANESTDFKESIKANLPIFVSLVKQVKLHRTLLGSNKLQAWELDLFSLTDNDMVSLTMIITDYAYNSMPVEQE